MAQPWPVRLFKCSVLKQRKLRALTEFLGDTSGLHCLDIGADNGVISYFLRQRGGTWKSADLDPQAVESIRTLVYEAVFQIDGSHTPFATDEFDRVVVVDYLEHIHTDAAFIQEIFRILKPQGEVILNVPHLRPGLLRRLRLALGQTDEKHGHVRPGYTLEGLRHLLGDRFAVSDARTYSKFFSECIDTLLTAALDLLKGTSGHGAKGRLVTGDDLQRYGKMFRLYAAIYPLVWCMAMLDRLLWWRDGYMLIVRAESRKAHVHAFVHDVHAAEEAT